MPEQKLSKDFFRVHRSYIVNLKTVLFRFFMVDSVSLWAKLALIGGIAVTTIISMFTTKKSSQLMNEFFSILTQAALKSPEERLKKLPLQEHSIKCAVYYP